MTRAVKGSVKRRKRYIKLAKGYYGRRKNTIRVAKQAVHKGDSYAYRDRRNKKRRMRAMHIIRINAAVRQFGMVYSEFICALKKHDITLNRAALSCLAQSDERAIMSLVEMVKG